MLFKVVSPRKCHPTFVTGIFNAALVLVDTPSVSL